MKRIGMVIRVKHDRVAEYKALHAKVWPEVLKAISAANIRNYTIFLREPENLLFSYYEYHGVDYEGDLRRIAADSKTQEWWKFTAPCQQTLPTSAEGEWWASMEEVFHHE